jgi:hypothetical protein
VYRVLSVPLGELQTILYPCEGGYNLRCSHMLVTPTKWLLIYYSIVEYKLVLRTIYHHLHAAFIVGTITIKCPTHMDLGGHRIYAILTQQSVYFQFSRLAFGAK